MISKLYRFLMQRGVLVRTVCYALTLMCIPLMLFSFTLTADGKKDILQAWEDHSQSVAESAASHFGQWMEQMISVAQSINTDSYLQASRLNESSYSDREAIKMLRSYKTGLPYVSECGLFLHQSPDLIFTSNGKYDLSVYLQHVLKLDDSAFQAFVNQTDAISFLSWDNDRQYILCAIPLFPSSNTNTRRTCLFLLPNSKVQKYFLPITGGSLYQLAAVFSPAQQPIYFSSLSSISPEIVHQVAQNGQICQYDDNAYFASHRVNGYLAVIAAPTSAYTRSAVSFETSLRIIITVNTCLSLLIAAVLTWLNYKPVVRLMKGMNLPSFGERDEFQSIMDAYAFHKNKVVALEQENDENRTLLLGNLLEKLLDGGNISGDESRILEAMFGSDGCFFAAIARIDDVPIPSVLQHILSKYSGIFLFEMLQDGYFAFLCRVESPADRTALASQIQKMVETLLSVGSVDVGWKTLHKSYLEAILAFDRELTVPVVYYEQSTHIYSPNLDNRSMELMQLARSLKNCDESALVQTEALFDDVINCTPSSLLFQRYACYQLLESMRRLLSKLEITLSSEQIAQILNINNLQNIRAAFMDLMKQALKQIRLNTSEQQASLFSQMQHMTEIEYTNSDFGLDRLAEAFNMTEYSASRIFKDAAGVNFKKYLTCLRIDHAKKLLNSTSLNINDVSVQVGFASSSYFTRVFKTEVGVSPAVYRQTNQHS